MAFEVQPRTAGQPEQTTVTGIHFARLGRVPVVTFDYADTRVDQTAPVEVLASTEVDGSFLSVILSLNSVPNIGDLPGALIVDGTGTLGKVRTVETTIDTVILELATPLTEDPTGKTVRVVYTNTFGNRVHIPAELGTSWSNVVRAEGAGFNRGAAMQISIGTKMVLAALQALGITDHTPQQVAAAVQGLAMQGVTIEALMTVEAESLELARRAGTAPEVLVQGMAP